MQVMGTAEPVTFSEIARLGFIADSSSVYELQSASQFWNVLLLTEKERAGSPQEVRDSTPLTIAPTKSPTFSSGTSGPNLK